MLDIHSSALAAAWCRPPCGILRVANSSGDRKRVGQAVGHRHGERRGFRRAAGGDGRTVGRLPDLLRSTQVAESCDQPPRRHHRRVVVEVLAGQTGAAHLHRRGGLPEKRQEHSPGGAYTCSLAVVVDPADGVGEHVQRLAGVAA